MRGIAGKLSIVLAVVFVAAACGGATTTSTPTTTASALATTPTFEPMSYMSKLQTNGKIRVGTQEDNTPFSVKNPITSKWEGFDVDVARELAKAIFGSAADPDAFIEYVPVVSATRIPSLTDGKADVIIKTFTITEERKQQIDFSDVYFITGQRILVKKDNTTIKEAADLAGKTVCAQKGSTSEQNMTKATDGKAKPLLLDSYPACLLALQQGQVDAVSTDETIFFGGLWVTVQISALGLAGALIIGTGIALLRVSPLRPLRWIGAAYVEFFRNTPLVVQLFFLFLGLPLIGFRFASDTFDNIFRAA